MFTGIITDIGVVRRVENGGDTRITLGTAYAAESIVIGASIACDGCCLTVVERGCDAAGHWFMVQASAETLSCTTLGSWREGRRVNLERALRVGDELGGHFVSGHVDGIARLMEREAVGDSAVMAFEASPELVHFIAEKGSVTLDGVALTVNQVEGARFWVNIIPHTLAATTLGQKQTGDLLNIEIDLISRYAARLKEFE